MSFSSHKYCLMCGKEFDDFLVNGKDFAILQLLDVVGAGQRKTRCPFCRSKDRERLIYLFLKENKLLFKNKEKQKVLHIAPEPTLGNILKRQKNIDYISGDLNPDKAEKILNVELLPYKDNTFDSIICNHVLEHVTNDNKAMAELFRVLKSGGWAILQVPYAKKLKFTIEDKRIILPKDRETYFGQNDHLRIYSLNEYTAKLKKTGFKVKTLPFAKKLDKKFIKKHSINPDELIIYCEKHGVER